MIGIVTDYNHSIANNCAIVIADLAASLGSAVRIYSRSEPARNVHPTWDKNVTAIDYMSFESFTSRCTHLLWFCYDETLIRIAKKRNKLSYYIVDWTKLPEDLAVLGVFDRCICLSRPAFNYLSLRKQYLPIAWVDWDCGSPILPHNKPADHTTAYWPCIEKQFAKDMQAGLVPTAIGLLQDQPDLTLVLQVNDFKYIHQRLYSSDLVNAYLPVADRLRFSAPLSVPDRHVQYLSADWTIYLPSRENSCHIPLESLCCGRPVITWDLDPIKQVIRKDKNGILLQTTAVPDDTGVPQVTYSNADLRNLLASVLRQRDYCAKLVCNTWAELEQRRRNFTTFWKIALDLYYPDPDELKDQTFFW